MDQVINKTRGKARTKRFFIPGGEFARVAVSALGFFIGRAVFMKTVNPVCVGFLGALLGEGYSFYAAAAFITAGLFTKLKGFYLARYILSIGLMCAANFGLRRMFAGGKRGRLREVVQGGVSAGALLVGGLVCAWLDSGNAYLAILSALESAMVFSAVFVLKKSTNVLYGRQRRRFDPELAAGLRRGFGYRFGPSSDIGVGRVLRQDEMISLAVATGALIVGASDIFIGELSLRYFLCIFFTILIAYKSGAATGGVSGMLIGFMLHVAGYWDVGMAVVFAAAGIGGGVFRDKGRLASLGCGLAFGAGCMWYAERGLMGFELLYSAIFAGLLFFLVPWDFSLSAAALNPSADNTNAYMDRVKDMAIYKLTRFADAFEHLAGAFGSGPAKAGVYAKKDLAALAADAEAKACGACPKRRFCWEDNHYYTYQNVFAALNACEKLGAVTPRELEKEFAGLCVDAESFTERVSRVYDAYRTNKAWEARVAESRELAGQQLSGVTGIIRRLADEIDLSLKFHGELEERVMRELSEARIDADSVVVVENGAGRFEADIFHKPYYEKKPWARTAAGILSKALKRDMRLVDETPVANRGRYVSRFVEERKLCVNSGAARLAKSADGVSGDTYSFMELRGGQCMLTLADGMGIGARARDESAATVELLEDFVESGFEKNLAVRIINSALVLRGADESFSTLDVCCADLYTGEAEFIKLGAASTFVRRGGQVTVIGSSSLPMGALAEADVEVSRIRLGHGDVVLMVTDGTLDAGPGAEDAREEFEEREAWICEVLRDCKYVNPQDIADMVMMEAGRRCNGRAADDMTVLAARFWDNR